MREFEVALRVVAILICWVAAFVAFDFAFQALNAQDNLTNYLGVILIFAGLGALFLSGIVLRRLVIWIRNYWI